MISNSYLHHTILKYIIVNGYAPDVKILADILNRSDDDVIKAMHSLAETKGVVLHPQKQKVWLIPPFSLAPTNFYVQSKNGGWWGNCAWCSLGIVALINEDAIITTSIGAHGKQIEFKIEDGEIGNDNLLVHFPVPIKRAWENVVYFCSTLLVFENEEQIDSWTKQHNIPKGDIQPLEKVWQLAQRWYGNYLDTNWKKRTAKEAKVVFDEIGLTHSNWKLK